MRDAFLVFGSPQIEQAEIDEVVATLKSGWIGTGPRVQRFEREFAAFKGVEHVASVGSCTAALHLSILSAGLGPGDEVITTAMTFCATVNAVIHSGARPVLADIDPQTMNINPEHVATLINAHTRAIIPVHFAGRPCDMDKLTAMAERHNLTIIEDCAHAIEAEYKGRNTGTFGSFGCFSFYVTKNLVTCEGGMVVCSDAETLGRIKTLALHGMSSDAWKRFSDAGYQHYLVVQPGYKYNMTDLQAAIGIHQLARIEQNHSRRGEIWATYERSLADLPLLLPAPPEPDTRHAFHLYTVRLTDESPVSRDEFLIEMTKRKIGVGVHYLSIPEHPYYRETFGWQPEDYPVSMDIGRRTVSLPLSPKLTDSDVEDVIEAVRDILEH